MKFNVHAGHNPDGKTACGAAGILKESTEARRVVKYLKRYLRASGHTVYDCTCNDGKSQSDVLNRIVRKCNAHEVSLDISVHFNSGAGDRKGNGATTGTEVLVYDASKAPAKAAASVCAEITRLGFRNRGVKSNPSLYVLNSTKAPAMLVECCFVDDADDARLYRAKEMAAAIAAGILNSYGTKAYAARKEIRSFTPRMKKAGTVKRGEACNIDRAGLVGGYFMGHRKKKDDWVKMKYLKLK